jgi:chromosome segregation ATPase
VADDLTLGELARSLADFKQSIRQSLKDGDNRLAELAGKMVPTDLWKAEHRALEEDVKHLEADVREAVARLERTSLERLGNLNTQLGAIRDAQKAHERAHRESSAWSRSKKLTVLGITVGAAATIAAAWLAALLAARGVH